jgi:hypothetical protein
MTTLTITGERLMAMYDNEMKVYGTPNSYEPYWASHPSFMYDVCLATVDDLIDQGEWDALDEDEMQALRTDETAYTFEIAVPQEDGE